ncbi:helicase-related protein, partial [Planctomycetota bacterium]
ARGKLIDRFRDDPGTHVFFATDAGGVGLNLQAASAVINLDLPWNPAVLEQRIARVHRLGQRDSVHVIRLFSAGSYEERVAQIVETKRELFRNVVEEDAQEDVVGMQKRLVELAMEAVDDEDEQPKRSALPSQADQMPADSGSEADGETPASAQLPTPEIAHVPVDASFAPVVDDLGKRLGERIQRVVVSGRGLLAVVDTVDSYCEAAVEAVEATADIPIAVVDSRTAFALERLGAPQMSGTQALGPAPTARKPSVNQLVPTAHRKLAAGTLLLDQGCVREGLELLAAAILNAAAVHTETEKAPPITEAPVWIYGDLIPNGRLSSEDAGTLARVVALAAAPSLPTELAARTREEVTSLVTRWVPRAT